MRELSLLLLMGALSVVAATVLGERCHIWWMTESGFAILVGMFVGLLWYATTQLSQTSVQTEAHDLEMLEFQPAVFTLLLLPPIIFESGYNLNHRPFFQNIGGVLTFAFIGTLVAFSIMAPSLYYGLGGAHGLLTPMESCAFAALIVAVDPVATLAIFSSTGADPKLNSLVFGESVLNDAVAIVLFKTVVQLGEAAPLAQQGPEALSAASIFGAVGSFCLIFLGSVGIGVIGGCAIALLFKLVNMRSLPASVAAPAELICLICLSYSTFLLAEYARLSGIVASLFSGAVCVVYVQRNLSVEGATLCKTTVRVLAKLCETIVFVLMGYGFWLYTIGGTPPARLGPDGNGSQVPAGSKALVDPCIPPDLAERVPMEPSFIVLTLAMCLLSRGVSVFPLAAFANAFRSPEKRIRIHEQAVIWFSGLRGAIALALAVEFPTAADVQGMPGEGNFCYQREHVVACTIMVVMCTVFVLGGFTKPVLNLCGIEMGGGHGAGDEVTEAPEQRSPPTSKQGWKRALINAHNKVLKPVLVAEYDPRAAAAGAARNPPHTPAEAARLAAQSALPAGGARPRGGGSEAGSEDLAMGSMADAESHHARL